MSLSLSKKQVTKHIEAAAAALHERMSEVNRMNVFPVADNDTGYNMYSSIHEILVELRKLNASPSTEELCKAVQCGSANGARGNSGVIFSNIVGGVCEAIIENQEKDTKTIIVKALDKAAKKSRKGCTKPKDGTILSTIKDMAVVAHKTIEKDKEADYKALLRNVSNEAFASAKRTPEILAIHKQNGVIDAGAFGLAIIVEGFVGSITGKNAIIPNTETFLQSGVYGGEQDISDENFHYEIVLQFDNRKNFDMNRFVKYLSKKGGSIQVAGNEPIYKMHVHTNSPQDILAYAIRYGEVVTASIENLALQLETLEIQKRKKIGIVAVASGDGIIEILKECGADRIIEGGQTINPSVKEVVEAIESINAETIILLPNNKNIIMTADKALEMVGDKHVILLPTTCVQQALAALATLSIAEETECDDIIEVMKSSISNVSSGEITFAMRDAKMLNGTPIKERDMLGLLDNDIVVVSTPNQSLADIAAELINWCLVKRFKNNLESDTLTIFTGCELSADDRASVHNRIFEKFSELEIYWQRGNQPLYPIIFSIE